MSRYNRTDCDKDIENHHSLAIVLYDTRDARAPEKILSSSVGMGLSFNEHIVVQTDKQPGVFLFFYYCPNSSVAGFSSLGGGELICEVEIKFALCGASKV